MTAQLPELRGRIALGTATPSIHHERRHHASDVATIRAATEAGIGIVDTARAYARADDPFSGERLVAEAIEGRDGVIVMSKGGHWRVGPETWDVDNSAARLHRDIEDSLRVLGRTRLDVFLVHRADEITTDVDETLDELLAIRSKGLAARVGLSNANAESIEYAASRGAVDVVQNRHGVGSRDTAALAVAERLGIPYFAYSPLRTGKEATLAECFPLLCAVARERGVSLPRLVLRGILAESPVLSIVSGATRLESMLDTAAAPGEPWTREADEAYRTDLTEHVLTRKAS